MQTTGVQTHLTAPYPTDPVLSGHQALTQAVASLLQTLQVPKKRSCQGQLGNEGQEAWQWSRRWQGVDSQGLCGESVSETSLPAYGLGIVITN